MIEIKKNYIDNRQENAIIVGIRRSAAEKSDIDEHLDELRALAKTAGALVKEQVVQERNSPDPAHFVGTGKLEEIRELVEEHEARLVIFDDELSPAQIRNISIILPDVKVIDRTGLILDIFADHAKTIEAKTQVELAQLNYLLPRLTRAWQHLSRQVGGIGTKGPGETQLETDRRLVRTRIGKLKSRLLEIEKQNLTRAQNRENLFRVALIGYTNAGKSTLMNVLTNSNVITEDKLFATLDTTIRRMNLSDSMAVLISDTVGFIRKLPHQLVASFRSTLAESSNADLLLHIVDISHPQYNEHIDVVNSLLNEIDINVENILLVFNKVDCIENKTELQHLKTIYENALFISASRHIGINNLKKAVLQLFDRYYIVRDIKLRFSKGAGEHLVRSFASVLDKTHDDEFLYLKIKYHRKNEYKVSKIISAN